MAGVGSNWLLPTCPDVRVVCTCSLACSPHHSPLSFTKTANGPIEIVNKHLRTVEHFAFRGNWRGAGVNWCLSYLLFYSYSLVLPTVSPVFSSVSKLDDPSRSFQSLNVKIVSLKSLIDKVWKTTAMWSLPAGNAAFLSLSTARRFHSACSCHKQVRKWRLML
jgi:hypothetical protein